MLRNVGCKTRNYVIKYISENMKRMIFHTSLKGVFDFDKRTLKGPAP